MKTTKLLLVLIPLYLFSSCVSSKKFKAMDTAFKQTQADQKNCNENLRSAQAMNADLTSQKNALQAHNDELAKQVADLRKSSSQLLGTLQDMSVMSGKQAESVKQSLDNISAKDSYIGNLQSAIARKDSLNMALVMNLKGAIGDLNDKDISIKVEKGVIYVDISDKLLFNSGKYNVTDKAKEVLGKVAKVLNAHPDIEFMVEGHTDNVPIHTAAMEDNWDLSTKRAAAVIRILQEKYGMKPERMTAAGRSEYIPVASNSNAEGRALNRRTRIVILPQIDQFLKLLTRN